jgi:hypothetical protein
MKAPDAKGAMGACQEGKTEFSAGGSASENQKILGFRA